MERERVFKNTFEPSCRDRELRVSGIVAGLRCGVFKYSRLPPEVRKAVDEEVGRAKGDDKRHDWKLNMLDIEMAGVRRVESPRLGTKSGACRMLDISMPSSLLARGVPIQRASIERGVEQSMAPNEPGRIVALIELG